MTALQFAVAFVVGVLGVARAVRLIVSDAYPPMQNVRVWWEAWQGQRDSDSPPSRVWGGDRSEGRHILNPLTWRYGWGPLLTCPFCASPYVTAVAVAGAVWAGVWSPELDTLAGWWWVLAVWAAGSYLAAMVVVRDEPPPVEA